MNPYTESYDENNIGWCQVSTSPTVTIDEKIASASDCKKTGYVDVDDTRSAYLFGTYSFKNFNSSDNVTKKEQTKLYLFENFNKITDGERVTYSPSAGDENKVIEIGIKEDGDKYTLKDVGTGEINWVPQQISYGTYGDLTLYSYLDKYYDLAFIFNYVDWDKSYAKGDVV